MKIKIVGFKVGESRPTANRTVSMNLDEASIDGLAKRNARVGNVIIDVIIVSDFISIRRVDE
jgi:hypothetical protein